MTEDGSALRTALERCVEAFAVLDGVRAFNVSIALSDEGRSAIEAARAALALPPSTPPEDRSNLNICVCGRQIASIAGLRYCAGCGQAVCSCVLPPSAPPALDVSYHSDFDPNPKISAPPALDVPELTRVLMDFGYDIPPDRAARIAKRYAEYARLQEQDR